ncbi:MAG: bifunctional adenosylcobinamide kinase/adenosylcobinamide-phosphate guanylyltransferase [Gammaproteobacteria bacterium]|nr:bifunctional adenosylcobinamide kinase/adenosylcobinamide-phosphate guanylyltransferase [Gammaproteobacteria bacterium]
MKHFIIGGARSGKSALAEQLAVSSGLAVVYVATATAGDPEMERRIITHRASRPADWTTVEEPVYLTEVLTAHDSPGCCILVDCLTLWLTNLLLWGEGGQFESQRDALLESVPRMSCQLIFVSNEVGMGIVPMGELSRRFQDEAGRLNQSLAALCDRVVLTVAGLPLVIKGTSL